jgi:hypothetical protein
MAESRRNKQREIFRQQLAQTWDDAQIHHVPEPPSEPWESDRVVEVTASATPPPAPPRVPPEAPPGGEDEPDFSLTPPKLRHPVFEMVRNSVRLNGFTHPEAGSFIMFPREFGAILTLEKKAVVQVVYHIICETIGWVDPNGRGGRREWVQLGLRDFEIICGSKSQGSSGVKTALQKGYIIRRPYKNGFEYSLRWKEQKD